MQLDEKVEELVNEKMDSTVPNEVQNILASSIKTDSFKSRRFPDKYSKKVNNNETQHGGGFGKRGRIGKSKNKIKTAKMLLLWLPLHRGLLAVLTTLLKKRAKIMRLSQSTIPVTQQLATPASTPQNARIPFRSGNRGSGRGRYFGKGGRSGNNTGSGFGWSFTKHSSEFDAYCMDVAPLNNFEN